LWRSDHIMEIAPHAAQSSSLLSAVSLTLERK
jgi:hypothetical protein